jgi:predicted permease
MPRWLEWLIDLGRDLRYAVRTLAKQPGFSATVITVLTLGIGLNAAVFTMLKGLVLTPLAGVDDVSRLTVLFAETDAGRQVRVSYPEYVHLRDRSRAFERLFGSSLLTVNMGRGRSARQITAELVTGDYFEAFGIRAQLGRVIQPSDEVTPGAHPVLVLSDSLWRRDFNADPAIVGRIVEINNYPLTVVGVAAAPFRGTIVTYDIEVFIPVTMMGEVGITGGLPAGTPSAVVLADRRAQVVFPHGYLRAGATRSSAAAEMEAAWASIRSGRPIGDVALQLRTVPFWQSPTGGQRFILPTLVVLSAMGVLVLLIACANTTGLVLVRGMSRRGEIAVRLALGAPRSRLIRLLLAESLVLAIPGALLGFVLARRGLPPLIGYADWLAAPQRLYFNVDADGLVIAFAALMAVVSALVAGFVPALQSTRVDLVTAINEDASPRGAARGRLRGALVVAQVAVSLLLLVGAGLASRTVAAAKRADPGFDGRGVASLEIDVRLAGYDEARGRVFYQQLLEAVRRRSGVESAALDLFPPLNLIDTRAQRVIIEGYEPRDGEDLSMLFNVVSTDYFRTLRIPIVAGRTFDDHDDERGEPVVIVNRTLAERFWGSTSGALGRRLRGADNAWRRVVGVAADVKYTRVDAAPRPYLYLPFPQSYRPNVMLQVRGTADAIAPLLEDARTVIDAIDANLPVLSARPLQDRTRGAFLFYDLTATMLSVFGVAGMLLAAMGTYGLVAYVVRQSTREIGIRVALGASRLSVVRAFVSRGLRLGVAGTVLGVVAAVAVARLLGSVLYGVTPTDAVSFGIALAIVLGGVLLATVLPAWRAARTDALTALRHQ